MRSSTGGSQARVPRALGIHDRDRSAFADPQAVCLRAENAALLGQLQLLEPALQELPRGEPRSFSQHFGVRLIAAEKDVASRVGTPIVLSICRRRSHADDPNAVSLRMSFWKDSMSEFKPPRCTASVSEAVTHNVRVEVESQYAPEHSQPFQNQWFFHYTVRITNEGDEHRSAPQPPLDHHRRDRTYRGSARDPVSSANSRCSRRASRSSTRRAARSGRRPA